ncbi:hypothetical protein ALC53_06781 [Atta colombica]|uniref:Uncharacterized protein n=1 Tax=Atta colombica TaxID=520822 RepID=A0A151I2U2_9HYME|nr:hypothetical protein ALC53_06781 [Atta colombica]
MRNQARQIIVMVYGEEIQKIRSTCSGEKKAVGVTRTNSLRQNHHVLFARFMLIIATRITLSQSWRAEESRTSLAFELKKSWYIRRVERFSLSKRNKNNVE